MPPSPFTYDPGQPQPFDPSVHATLSSGSDMSGVFALFAVLAIISTVAGIFFRFRYGMSMGRYGYGGGWGYRPWGGPPFPPAPMQPPVDPYVNNHVPYGMSNAGDPYAQATGGMQPPAPADCGPPPGFDPGASAGGGFASCDPGPSPSFSGGDAGGGTAGSIPS